MDRPTIKDIANAAGVSAGAVSFALNDKPGVSDATRARIRSVAEKMGWRPNVAALALSGNRAGAIGLVIARPEESFAGEGFFLHLIAGMEDALTSRSLALVLQLVAGSRAELEVHRRWWAQQRVDGVVLVDPALEDPRWELFGEIGMPAVVVGADDTKPLPGVHTDDAAATEAIVAHLAEGGHRLIGRVGGSPRLSHTELRAAAFELACRRHGMESWQSPATDFSERSGERETAAMLDMAVRPTAVVYDNEVLALGGVSAIRAKGLRVPDDVAVVSFEDSPICRVMSPQLTALQRDPSVLGRDAVSILASLVEGQPAEDVVEPTPQLVVRGSTGRATAS